MYVIPGDPARLMLGQRADVASIEAIRKQLGLDDPLYVQYFRFIGNIVCKTQQRPDQRKGVPLCQF